MLKDLQLFSEKLVSYSTLILYCVDLHLNIPFLSSKSLSYFNRDDSEIAKCESYDLNQCILICHLIKNENRT